MKNNKYVLIMFLIFMSQTPVLSVTVQEKSMVYQQLADLENQKKLLRAEYEKAMENELSEDARNMVEQEYTQKIKDISEQIEEQKKMLEAATKQELLWNGAKLFGVTGLFGLLAYTIFRAARLPQPISLPIKVTSKDSPLEISLLSQQDFGMFDHQKNSQDIPKTSPYILPPHLQQSVDAKDMAMELQATRVPLTAQEKALYELRYKNLRDASALYSVMFVFGQVMAPVPIVWPIELILFGITTLSGAGAAYYYDKIKP